MYGQNESLAVISLWLLLFKKSKNMWKKVATQQDEPKKM